MSIDNLNNGARGSAARTIINQLVNSINATLVVPATGGNGIQPIASLCSLPTIPASAVRYAVQAASACSSSFPWTASNGSGIKASYYKNDLFAGDGAVAHGRYNSASGVYSHAEGSGSISYGLYSHAEGNNTIASGSASHAEGYLTKAIGQYSHAEGNSTLALGTGSHAEGYNTISSGAYSHAEGYITTASGIASHAEGISTRVLQQWSHAEGGFTTVGCYGYASSDVGISAPGVILFPQSLGDISSEFLFNPNKIFFTTNVFYPVYGIAGNDIVYYDVLTSGFDPATGQTYITVSDINLSLNGVFIIGIVSNSFPTSPGSIPFGLNTSNGSFSHAEGYYTSTISGDGSHTEGAGTTTYAQFSHAEGNGTFAKGKSSHAEGGNSQALGDFSHAEGVATAGRKVYSGSMVNGVIYLKSSYGDVTNSWTPYPGFMYAFSGINSGSYVYGTPILAPITIGPIQYIWPAVYNTLTFNINTNQTEIVTFTNETLDVVYVCPYMNEGDPDVASGPDKADFTLGHFSHAEGVGYSGGDYSHAEGGGTTLSPFSHAEGNGTQAANWFSHAEGGGTISMGYGSHAEGARTITSGSYSHSEGNSTWSQGIYSHAEGYETRTTGDSAHSEGSYTVAKGDASHAEGYRTIAFSNYQHAAGRLNLDNNTEDYFVIGDGDINTNIRSNAFGVNATRMYASNSIYFPDLTQASHNNVLVFNTASGQVFFTASSAIGGGGSAITVYNGNTGTTLTSNLTTLYISGSGVTITSPSTGIVSMSISGGGGIAANPAPPDMGIQFNSGGAAGVFDADASFKFNYNTLSLMQGSSVSATGQYSHAQGIQTIASGLYSHAEGNVAGPGQQA